MSVRDTSCFQCLGCLFPGAFLPSAFNLLQLLHPRHVLHLRHLCHLLLRISPLRLALPLILKHNPGHQCGTERNYRGHLLSTASLVALPTLALLDRRPGTRCVGQARAWHLSLRLGSNSARLGDPASIARGKTASFHCFSILSFSFSFALCFSPRLSPSPSLSSFFSFLSLSLSISLYILSQRRLPFMLVSPISPFSPLISLSSSPFLSLPCSFSLFLSHNYPTSLSCLSSLLITVFRLCILDQSEIVLSLISYAPFFLLSSFLLVMFLSRFSLSLSLSVRACRVCLYLFRSNFLFSVALPKVNQGINHLSALSLSFFISLCFLCAPLHGSPSRRYST